MVPEVGLEPTRYCYQRILSPSRLPVPSFRRKGICAPKRMPAAGKRRGACAPAVNIVAHRAVVGKKKLPLRPALPLRRAAQHGGRRLRRGDERRLARPGRVGMGAARAPPHAHARRLPVASMPTRPSPSRPLPCPCA